MVCKKCNGTKKLNVVRDNIYGSNSIMTNKDYVKYHETDKNHEIIDTIPCPKCKKIVTKKNQGRAAVRNENQRDLTGAARGIVTKTVRDPEEVRNESQDPEQFRLDLRGYIWFRRLHVRIYHKGKENEVRRHCFGKWKLVTTVTDISKSRRREVRKIIDSLYDYLDIDPVIRWEPSLTSKKDIIKAANDHPLTIKSNCKIPCKELIELKQIVEELIEQIIGG